MTSARSFNRSAAFL